MPSPALARLVLTQAREWAADKEERLRLVVAAATRNRSFVHVFVATPRSTPARRPAGSDPAPTPARRRRRPRSRRPRRAPSPIGAPPSGPPAARPRRGAVPDEPLHVLLLERAEQDPLSTQFHGALVAPWQRLLARGTASGPTEPQLCAEPNGRRHEQPTVARCPFPRRAIRYLIAAALTDMTGGHARDGRVRSRRSGRCRSPARPASQPAAPSHVVRAQHEQ